MRRTALLRYSKFKLEQHFERVDQSIPAAERRAWLEEANMHKQATTPPQTTLEQIAATPELADTVLSVSTKLGSETFLIRPTSGNPTGLTELFQHPEPRSTLLKIYHHTISLLEDKYPKNSVYRISAENLTKARRAVVAENEDTDAIEQQVGSGLVEEILIQAAEEFRLAEELAEGQAWSELEEKPLPDQWIAHAFKDAPEGPR